MMKLRKCEGIRGSLYTAHSRIYLGEPIEISLVNNVMSLEFRAPSSTEPGEAWFVTEMGTSRWERPVIIPVLTRRQTITVHQEIRIVGDEHSIKIVGPNLIGSGAVQFIAAEGTAG